MRAISKFGTPSARSWVFTSCCLPHFERTGGTSVRLDASGAAHLQLLSAFASPKRPDNSGLFLVVTLVGGCGQGRDRRITGLIEALRLLPPRPPPGVEDEDLNSQHSSYAQNSEQAEPMPSVVPSATAFSDAIAAAAPLAADSSCGSTSEKQDTGPTNNPSHGTAQSDKSAGGKRSKGYHPVATTQALFAMGVIGGPLLFEEEMTALLEVYSIDHSPEDITEC
jgi:hypothetical protein